MLISIVTLIVAWRILRAIRRSEQAGVERLEILREQQQRLDVLDEERRQLLQALELQRQEMDEQKRRPELPPAPPDPAQPEGRHERPSWWRRTFGRG
jgi:hypothetical protein